jgi:hypothetical protein
VDILWHVLDVAFGVLLVAAIVYGIVVWLGPRRTTTGIASVAAVVAFFVLGWTQGNKLATVKLSEPVNWPLELRVIGAYPGVGDGACFDYIEPGLYVRPESGGDVTEDEVTEEQAARQNADVRACRAQAHRENRDYTKDWANWMSILLIGTAIVTGYDHWGHRKRAAQDADRERRERLLKPFSDETDLLE